MDGIKTTATKAATAGAMAFATAVGTQLADGRLTLTELGIAAGAFVATFAATWRASNKAVLPG